MREEDKKRLITEIDIVFKKFEDPRAVQVNNSTLKYIRDEIKYRIDKFKNEDCQC
ncbi:MAG: hypothetical protein HYV52_03775 [Parcubacteria group bacterium]|nr:hypothetical protein [Parcubacteria group bacterium]